MSREEALRIAMNKLDSLDNSINNDELIIIVEEISEKPYAWIIPWTSKLWYETKDMQYAIAGNSPFIVSKWTGEITAYSSAYSVSMMTELYEEERKLYGLRITGQLTDLPSKLLLKKLLKLSNQEVIRLIKEPTYWASQGGRKRLKRLGKELRAHGFETEVLPCF